MAYQIGIAGAGIGGLAMASLLAARGHHVTLAERFATPRPVGSGLVIQPVGLAVLDAVGVGAEARDLSAPITRMLGHAGTRAILDVRYRTTDPGRALHRASLFDTLWRANMGRITLHTGAAVTAAPQDGPRRWMARQDAPTLGPFDLVIDASGGGSCLSPLQPRALPFGAIWGAVPWPADSALPADQLRQRYFRASRMAGVLPIGRLPGDPTPRAAVFWSMPLAELDQWPQRDLQDWKAEVTAFWPDIAPFLTGLTATSDMTPARYSHGTLRQPTLPGLALIGDAAYRASPQLGQGANMALLDAMALALALDHPLDQALPRYASMRRWHRRVFQAMSAAFTPMYQSDSRALPLLRDRVLAPLGQLPPVARFLTGLVSGDILPPLASTAWPLPPIQRSVR